MDKRTKPSATLEASCDLATPLRETKYFIVSGGMKINFAKLRTVVEVMAMYKTIFKPRESKMRHQDDFSCTHSKGKMVEEHNKPNYHNPLYCLHVMRCQRNPSIVGSRENIPQGTERERPKAIYSRSKSEGTLLVPRCILHSSFSSA